MREVQPSKYAPYGNNLRALRQKSNMTKHEFAAIYGVSPTALFNYERATRIPFADKVLRIAHAFNTTMEVQ